LAEGRRVISLDPRGIGLSDRTQPPHTITIDDWVDDACSVLDATATASAHVFAPNHAGLVGLTLAARRPERVRSLTLINAFARSRMAPDYPHGFDAAMDATLREALRPRTFNV
jgi:pimeloyl-ACP methyl ester carboxylesterase